MREFIGIPKSQIEKGGNIGYNKREDKTTRGNEHMSDFSQMLDKHIQKSGLKGTELAKISGIDRTDISKMRTGTKPTR